MATKGLRHKKRVLDPFLTVSGLVGVVFGGGAFGLGFRGGLWVRGGVALRFSGAAQLADGLVDGADLDEAESEVLADADGPAAPETLVVYHQIQEVENPSRGLLLAETEPGTWQYGGCGCRWHAYKHPVRILARHYGGGNILHFDGNVHLAKDPHERRIDYWEPDYMDWNPGW